MMRKTRIGDIFVFITNDGKKRFFQYVSKDTSELYSDVIRIFSKYYTYDERPTPQDIISGEIECYVHTFLRWGNKMNLWEYYSNIPNVGGLDIWFRVSKDYGAFPKQKIVSNNWEVWKINEQKQFVGILPEKYYSASIGGVDGPLIVAQRLNDGIDPNIYYPAYKNEEE